MRDELKTAAKDLGNSMNAEIVRRLASSGLAANSEGVLTLRQWYAGQALAGMLSSEGNLVDEGCAFYSPDSAAERAFGFADAMLTFEAAEVGDA